MTRRAKKSQKRKPSVPEILTRKAEGAVALHLVTPQAYSAWLKEQPAHVGRWLESRRFSGKAKTQALIPSETCELAAAVGIVHSLDDLWEYARFASALPAVRYAISAPLSEAQATAAALGWSLGAYRYDRFKPSQGTLAQLVVPEGAKLEEVVALVEGITLCRDLITTPANRMGPVELAAAAQALAQEHGAKFHCIVGKDLLKKGYPAIHAVGRAAEAEPRLIDFTWGKTKHKKLTLVGKGVCFDTGGLDLKPAQYMELMKKDMGGGALVLGVAHAIMKSKLPVRLRVLIPAVENSVAGNAMRPLDVIETRKGLFVEVGNTDAEGRLVLADALTEADTERPDLIVDAATLTGAARVALGTSLPALFASNDELADAVLDAGRRERDPLWRLPLHSAYRSKLKSRIADLNNNSPGPYAGAITAALFLREFISRGQPWLHIDTMGYNLDAAPGRPVGGEAYALRALYRALSERYASATASTEANAQAKKPRSKPTKKTGTPKRKQGRKGG